MPPYSKGTKTSWSPSSSPEDIRRTSSSGNSSRSSSSISRESGSSRAAKSSIDFSAAFSMSALSSLAISRSPWAALVEGRLRHAPRFGIGPFPPRSAWNYGRSRTGAGRNLRHMNIAVAIRLMPKAGDELEVDSSGTDLDREYVDMTICDFDDQAVEEAVLIKEATGATVTAIGLRADGMEEALKLAYARGADRLVVVDAGDLDQYDARTAAHAFASAFRELAPDLVLTGVQTPYDVFGQTAPVLGVELGWPQASVVVGVTVEDGTARVVQEYAGGRLGVLGLQLPAVVGVQSASAPPRYVSMARLRSAMTEAGLETLAVSVEAPGAARKIVALARPEPQAHATMLEGDAEELAAQIVAVLRERGALVS